MIQYESVTRCIHVVQAFATCDIVINITITTIIMVTRFVWAVATWWQGRLYIYGGNFYGTRAAADDEYEELGRSLDTRVLAGKCFVYMHAVRR